MKKGFTLVELSIVLVIIGLLIGGILVAQSMINTTKIQATVRQLGQFDAAVGNFQTTFGFLPGDSPMVGSGAVTGGDGNGDQDGIIERAGGLGAVSTFSGEMGTFWNALSLTGLSTKGVGLSGTTYVQARGVPAGSLSITGNSANIPASPAGAKNSGFVAFGTAAGVNWYEIITTSQYTASAPGAFISAPTSSALKPADALAIDAKIDDGIGNAGNVMGGGTTVSGPTNVMDAGCGPGATYLVSTTTEVCDLAIRIGAQTGNLN